jgi:hypothetical protein
MTTATKLRHAPPDWKPGLTRVRHIDGEHGTYVRNSQPLPGTEPNGWLGVLVRFDGSRDLVDVDPADLTVTCLRDRRDPAHPVRARRYRYRLPLPG